MNIAIYARGSTRIGQDPAIQLRELREYCLRRGQTVVAEYVEAGISGAKGKLLGRPRSGVDAAEIRRLRTQGRQGEWQGPHQGYRRLVADMVPARGVQRTTRSGDDK